MAGARTAAEQGAGGSVAAAGRGVGIYLRAMAGFLVAWHLAALAIDNRILMPTPPAVAVLDDAAQDLRGLPVWDLPQWKDRS